MQLLRTLHAYAGLVLGMLMAMYGITGGALVFKEDIWRAQYPQMQAVATDGMPADTASILGQIESQLGGAYTAVMFPDKDLPAHHVYTATGEALFDSSHGNLLADWRWYETLTGILTELHFHLAAGRPGKKTGGFVAIVAVLMVISGLVLWWPIRRSFRISSMRPGSTRRAALIRMHRDLGTLTAISLVLFSVTAVGVIFSGTTRAVLNVFSTAPVHSIDSSDRQLPEEYRPTPTASQIDAAQGVFPGARLVAWYPPKTTRPFHYFRFQLPGEVHPNGRSRVHIDLQSDRVLGSVDATRQPAGERAWYWFYPLHAGKVGGVVYTAFTLLSALAITLIGITGFWSFLKRRRKPSRTP